MRGVGRLCSYAIAAASLSIRHTIVPAFQIEPNAYARTGEDFHTKSYIFHYTYGIEYTLQGHPQGFNTIGEWSIDKRHCKRARGRSGMGCARAFVSRANALLR